MSLPKGCGWFTGHAAGSGSRCGRRPCPRVGAVGSGRELSRGAHAWRPWRARTCRAVPALLHAAAQDLVGRDQHHADDEGHGEGADEALAHARLAVLLLGVHCGDKRGVTRGRASVPSCSHIAKQPTRPSSTSKPAHPSPSQPFANSSPSSWLLTLTGMFGVSCVFLLSSL